MTNNLPEFGPTEPNHTWQEKQDFIVRFIDELGTFIEHKCSEFELPPVVVIGALEVLKNEWLNPAFMQEDNSSDDTEGPDACEDGNSDLE